MATANPYDKMFQYPVGDTKNLTEIVNEAKRKLKNTSTKKNYESLEKYLQGVFYPETIKNPTEEQKEKNKKIRQMMAIYLEEKLQKTVADFSFSSGEVSTTKTSKQIIPQEKYESYSHKNYIEIQTLGTRLEKAKKALQDLKEEDFATGDEYLEIQKELNELIESCNYIIKNGPKGTRHDSKLKVDIPVIRIKNDDTWVKKVAELDSAYASLTYLYDMPIPNWLLGEVFERGLQLALQSIDYEEITKDLIKELFSQATQGQKTTSRGKLNLGIKDYKIVPSNDKKSNNFTYEVKSPSGNKSFKISGVFSSKQQKMDVELDFGNDNIKNKNFRVSAKNWKTLSGQDFGETDLEGALLRNGTLYDALTYGLQLGWIGYGENRGIPYNTSYENQLHDYARINLILDIVMGYSQESGYANTIIINDRSAKKIRVYSIRKILDDIKQQIIDLSKASNYNEDAVKRVLGEAFDWTEHLNTIEYENKLLTALGSMKFHVNTNILN